MATIRVGHALLLAGLLVTSADGWAQQKTVPPDADTQLRALRQQVAAMRKQLNAARGDLSAESTARLGVQLQFSTLQGKMESLIRQIDALKADLAGMKGNSVLDLNGYLTFEVSNGYPTAVFRGINVQIVNGMGETQTVNGTGNLIVGYNRPSAGSFVCSLGSADSASACAADGGVWAQGHKSGSHNIIGGDFNSYSSWGGLVLGLENATSAPYTAVLGGARNRAAGPLATVGGGSSNTASGVFSNDRATTENQATGESAAVSGGAKRSAHGLSEWAAGVLLRDR